MVVKILKRLGLLVFGCALAYAGSSSFPYQNYIPHDLHWMLGIAGWIIALGAIWSIVEIASADKMEKGEEEEEKVKKKAERNAE